MSEPDALEALVREFAEDVLTRVLMCLEGEPKPDVLEVDASTSIDILFTAQVREQGAGSDS